MADRVGQVRASVSLRRCETRLGRHVAALASMGLGLGLQQEGMKVMRAKWAEKQRVYPQASSSCA